MLHDARMAPLQALAQDFKHLAVVAHSEPKSPAVESKGAQQVEHNINELARSKEALEAIVRAKK